MGRGNSFGWNFSFIAVIGPSGRRSSSPMPAGALAA